MKIKNTAFTLIELLVVIVIISILATISVATFQGYFEKARMAKAKAMAVQMQRLFLTQNASTEENLFAAWYSFDEGINSSNPYVLDKLNSGNNLRAKRGDGTCVASEDTSLENGKSFRSDHCELLRGAGESWPEKKITMAFWMKIKNIYGSRTYPLWVYAKNLFWIYPDGTIFFRIYTGTQARSAAKVIEKDKWHYIVGSYENGIVRIFVDGELVAQQGGGSVPDNYFSQSLILGYRSGDYAFDGYLDDVMLINKGFDGKKLK